MPAATISAIGTALAGAGSAYSAFQGSPGEKWVGPGRYDYELGIEYGQKKQEAYAKDFQNYAKYMGVSPYALLGHNMPSGPAVPGSPMRDSESPLGKSMSKMGQSVSRGVQAYQMLQESKANVQLKQAQADLATAEANAIRDPQRPNSGPTDNDKKLVNQIPSKITRPAPALTGLDAGGSSASQVMRDEAGNVVIKQSEKMAEAREEQGFVEDVLDVIRDASKQVLRANSKSARTKIRIALIQELERTGRLKWDETVIWNPNLLTFQVMKRSKYINRLKNRYNKSRAREIRKKGGWTRGYSGNW